MGETKRPKTAQLNQRPPATTTAIRVQFFQRLFKMNDGAAKQCGENTALALSTFGRWKAHSAPLMRRCCQARYPSEPLVSRAGHYLNGNTAVSCSRTLAHHPTFDFPPTELLHSTSTGPEKRHDSDRAETNIASAHPRHLCAQPITRVNFRTESSSQPITGPEIEWVASTFETSPAIQHSMTHSTETSR